MRYNLCICSFIHPLATRTRVILLLHQLEAQRPSNTGRIAIQCLTNSAVVMRGGMDRTASPDWLAGITNPVLLFPHKTARPLERWKSAPTPPTLIVPDGTWRQAIKSCRRTPGLLQIPCATISDGAPSAYRLRSDPRPGRLCTLEAIARALGTLEDPAIALHLETVLRVMVERTLWARGQLSAGQVTGGIPHMQAPPIIPNV